MWHTPERQRWPPRHRRRRGQESRWGTSPPAGLDGCSRWPETPTSTPRPQQQRTVYEHWKHNITRNISPVNLESSHGEPGRLLCEGCVEVSLRRLSAGNLQTLAEHACVCASRRLMKCIMHTYSFPRSPMSPSISGIQEITQPRRIPFHLILLGRRSAQYRQGKSTRLFHAISVYNCSHVLVVLCVYVCMHKFCTQRLTFMI